MVSGTTISSSPPTSPLWSMSMRTCSFWSSATKVLRDTATIRCRPISPNWAYMWVPTRFSTSTCPFDRS
ncbi:hypothetical protein D3C85_1853410 [compost metagenome]